MPTEQPIALRGFAGEIEVSPDSEARKAEVIAQAETVVTVTNDQEQTLAVDAIRGLKTLRTETEAARKTIKAPVLALGKKIDEVAERYVAEIQKEENRLLGLANHYQRKLLDERRAAEQAAERERQRIESEAQEAARLAAEAEHQKQLAKAARALANLTTGSERDAAAAKAEQIAAEAKRLQEEAFERQLQAELEAENLTVPEAELPKGVSATESFDYEVLGANEYLQRESLAEFAAAFPHLVKIEIRRRDLLDAINAGQIKEAPGIRIFSTLKTRVR